MAPEIPYDRYHLIKKYGSIRKSLKKYRKVIDSKFRWVLMESQIHRLSYHYKTKRQLPSIWKYESSSASAVVS